MKRWQIKLTARQQLLLGVTGAMVVAVWLMRFLYLPGVARIHARQVQLKDLRVKIADMQGLAERFSSQEAILQEARERYKVLESRIGREQSVPRVLDAIGQLAKGHQLELIAVQPRANEQEASVVTIGSELVLEEIPLSLQLKGRYRHLAEFLGGLSQAPFLSSVRELAVKKLQPESPKLQADLVLVVYIAQRSSQRETY
jgi:Tfp pilus assembly protein PilO